MGADLCAADDRYNYMVEMLLPMNKQNDLVLYVRRAWKRSNKCLLRVRKYTREEKKGINVLCEKPDAVNVDEAGKISNVWQSRRQAE